MRWRKLTLTRISWAPVLLALICAISPRDSRALLMGAISLSSMKKYSAYIFGGTVLRSLSTRDSGRILTRVTFGDLRFAKGGPADTIRMTLEGGTVGDEMVVVTGQPGFVPGERCIVFATGDLGSAPFFMPVIGMGYGKFRVVTDSLTRRQMVLSGGMPVVNVSPERFSVVRPDSMLPARNRERYLAQHRSQKADLERIREEQPGPMLVLWEDEDPGTRITEEQFLAIVRSFPAEPEKPKRRSAPADSGGLLRTR